LSFNGGSLQNIRGVQPPVVSINKSIEALLFETAVKNDEKAAGSKNHFPEPPAQADPIAGRSADEQPGVVPVSEPEVEPITEILNNINDINDITEIKPTTFTEEFEMTEIQKILAEFTNIEGVHTACLVGRDGFLLDSLGRAGIDAEMIGAIASSGFGSAESMGNQLGQGDLRMTMFEYANGPVMFAPVGEEAFLVIVADQETNLGWIRISIKKNSKKIKEVASL
ncbi:MAG: hypothetical protein ACD_75C00377G0001, partial [uncultured bacterium]